MRTIRLIALIFFISGCSKQINYSPTNTGSLNEAKTNNVAVNTYLPLTKNTYWKYSVITEPDKPEASKLKVTDKGKLINGKNYQSVRSKLADNTDTIYYSQNAHDYYIYTNSGTSDADNVSLEILFLKDNAPVGETWLASAGIANGFRLNCYGKILEKNITLTISGTVYKNVIHSYIEIRKPFLFTYFVVNQQDFYTAENIGIIKNISKILLPTSSTTTTVIKDYNIE